jgi:hypothetical protein
MKVLQFALGSFLFIAFFATASMAQNSRTFVSGGGLDTNPCGATSPCRTFTRALSQTNAGGEVYVLDTAGYGPFSIAKSVTINAPQGVIAGITAISGDGIDINATVSDIVILRGLTVNNQGSNGSGIVFNTGGTLHIESCVANGFTNGAGIEINGPGNVFVKDTIARGNDLGIAVSVDTAGVASVDMDRVRLDANLNSGLDVEAVGSGVVAKGAIRYSSVSGNTGNGMVVEGVSSSVATLDIESCLVTNNNYGVSVSATDATAGATISNCTITRNRVDGFSIGGGTLYSRVNNTITGNAANSGSLTTLPAQ